MHFHSLLNAVRVTPFAFVTLFSLVALGRAQAAETITATARVKGRGGVEATAPVKVVIDRLSTDAERDEIMAALKKGGTEAVRNLLVTRSQIGSVQVGGTLTALKYIYARTTAGGRLITAVSGVPIAFVGAGAPGAPPKSGFDLGLVLLDLTASGSGRGELAPATKVKIDDKGAIVTQDYSDELVQLVNIGK